MTANPTQPTQEHSGSVVLRPEASQDQAFLFELYSSTRQQEPDAWGWPQEARAAFLKMQFLASQGYRTAFPEADFQIIVVDDRDAGRLAINRSPTEWRVVDLALLPQHRNTGIGSSILKEILAKAAAAKVPVRLSVLKGNRAQRLYARLGFVTIAETELYLEMESRPGLTAA